MRISDWSSDVCSSDLVRLLKPRRPGDGQAAGTRTSYLNQRLRIDADIVRRRAGGIDDRLRRLQALRDGGLISEEDYQARKSAILDELRSEEHTSELQSLMRPSYASLCFKKQNTHNKQNNN